jgi:hypothetical protein
LVRLLVQLAAAATAAAVLVRWLPARRRRRAAVALPAAAGRPRGPSNLLAVLLDAYWRSLADDPLATLLLMALVSLAGVLLFLLWHVAAYLVGQLTALL